MKVFNLLSNKMVIALSLATFTMPAYSSGIPTVDVANITQTTMTAMENIAQTKKQIDQYRKQLHQYELQLKNSLVPAAYIWDEAQRTMNDLVAATNTLKHYKQQMGDLDSYLERFQDINYYRSSPCFSSPGNCTESQREQLDEVRRLASESQKRANDALFQGIDQQQASLQRDAQQLERLQAAAQGAEGQMEAIQYANQIASQQANQLLQLRGLFVAQQAAVATENAAELDALARGEAREKQLRDWEYQPSPEDDF
ncbi:P-type conjugative transfer protein TrbJ [Halomonas eurihalina]|uniref:P-type conjugative transfer protein TrbJ n=1 Tax=Halomonas eurihalina TaxID=42566 RepID=A0A5D9DE28_HALER|nr:P-type conjugative transfer protein TrbJ [Halomonas eurihalina]MDR5857965.1 P-type conjugative transfer protein TrbJ [Halomonas eurihalina]TZG41522.1 P-type conjugative transfer protein TrbJ [Halomonas eurihalina]